METVEEKLARLREAAGEDAVTYAYSTDERWVCICGTSNVFQADERTQNCSSCNRNRDFVLREYGGSPGELDRPPGGGVSPTSTSSSNRSPSPRPAQVVSRYRSAYGLARTAVGVGTGFKGLAFVVGAVLLLLAVVLAGTIGMGAALALGLSAVVGVAIPWYILGVLLAAVGQLLLANLDLAVTSSPFLDEAQMREAMGL